MVEGNRDLSKVEQGLDETSESRYTAIGSTIATTGAQRHFRIVRRIVRRFIRIVRRIVRRFICIVRRIVRHFIRDLPCREITCLGWCGPISILVVIAYRPVVTGKRRKGG